MNGTKSIKQHEPGATHSGSPSGGRAVRESPGAAQSVTAFEPATVSEVSTKLELARTFLDMGDPESARHMLDEVLKEGDGLQRQEAQRLMDSMP